MVQGDQGTNQLNLIKKERSNARGERDRRGERKRGSEAALPGGGGGGGGQGGRVPPLFQVS